jgi:hypothetical protein
MSLFVSTLLFIKLISIADRYMHMNPYDEIYLEHEIIVFEVLYNI